MKPPFSPDDAVRDFAAVLKGYRLSEVTGDRYGAAWVSERFQKHGITYKPSERSRSEIYQATLPLIMEGNVRLLDHHKMLAQFTDLERRVNKGGKDSINHPTGGNDDVCNAAAGALCLAGSQDSSGYDLMRLMGYDNSGRLLAGA